MEPNELRIGNLVYKDGHFKNVCSVEWSDFNMAEYFEPIQLTEEWLLKFGWLWNAECKSYEKYPGGDTRMNLEFRELNSSYTMFNYVLKAVIAKKIRYVHQLQNLYFALTNEELKIN